MARILVTGDGHGVALQHRQTWKARRRGSAACFVGRAAFVSRALEDHPVLAFEAALVDAQLAGDVAALDRLLDERLHFIGLDGRAFSKADDLAAHRSGRIRITRMRVIDRHIVPLDDVAVVLVLMDSEAVVDGTVTVARLRYTRVWSKGQDGWKIVAGHMAVVAEPVA